MKKNNIFVLLLIFPLLQAQELDPNFLNSLPDDIRNDILSKAQDNQESAAPNYRSSEFSSKLELEDSVFKLKEKLEDNLEMLERRLQSDKKIVDDIQVFGSDFFSTFQTSFMPTNEPNPDSSYRLDAGDALKIQMIGQQDIIDTFLVSGDGSINIPDIGKIVVAGLTLNDAISIIKNKVTNIFIGTEAFVTLDGIRDVDILVSGNALNPGVYTLTGNSNILHALTMAGGISEFGSFRNINLIRNGKVVETLDIYDLLIEGKFIPKKRLRSGDIVFVEERKNLVEVSGAVKRPAIYELNDNQSLSQALNYSYGPKITADMRNVYLERILDGVLRIIPIVNISQFENIKPNDGDKIYLREHPFRIATINGAVLKPGSYKMAEGETLQDLIDKAGGFTSNAYPFGAIYENPEALKINNEAKDILYDQFLDNIISMSQQNIGENLNLSPIMTLASDIKNSPPNGRIVVDIVNENYGNKLNIMDGDSILIPESTNNVYVYGEVSKEGAVNFESNQNLEHYIDKTGGFKQFADFESIYILHPNGETFRFSQKRNIFEREPKNNVTIYPGSVIFVPRKLDDTATRRLATQAYVSILGNIGVALASLSAINNNN
jgi:protein involved in polysaccharide export with SLBB domain